MNNKLTLGILGAAAVGIIALAVILIVVVSGGGGDKKQATDANGTPSADAKDDSTPAAGELRLRGEDPSSSTRLSPRTRAPPPTSSRSSPASSASTRTSRSSPTSPRAGT